MTGFGCGEVEVDGVFARVELRSVNHRFCEVSARLPRSLRGYEHAVQARIRKHFERGHVTVHVEVHATRNEAPAIRIDPEAVRFRMSLLDELRGISGLAEPIRLDHLLRDPEIFQSSGASDPPAEATWVVLGQALDKAIGSLRAMRREEGMALLVDLDRRLETLTGLLARVEARAPVRVEEARSRLEGRLEEVLGDDRVDVHRLEMEIALLAERLDVTEECVRLRSHLDQFRTSLHADQARGRKLQFISQEIHREVNTIGAKANDLEIAPMVVAMKDELEKIREQLQNVE